MSLSKRLLCNLFFVNHLVNLFLARRGGYHLLSPLRVTKTHLYSTDNGRRCPLIIIFNGMINAIFNILLLLLFLIFNPIGELLFFFLFCRLLCFFILSVDSLFARDLFLRIVVI